MCRRKSWPRPGALAGALDDAGDVRHDEADALVHIDHAQIGVQGGEVVVGDLGLGLGDHAESSVDLPTLGKPTSPTSASSFSSSTTSRLSPGRPALAKRGTCRVGVAKCWLPQPPRPPLAQHEGLVVGHVLDDLAGLGVPHHACPGAPG